MAKSEHFHDYKTLVVDWIKILLYTKHLCIVPTSCIGYMRSLALLKYILKKWSTDDFVVV